MTAFRGREANTLHVVAETRLQARELFVQAMTRESGDRSVENKRDAAARDLQGTVGTRTHSESQRAQAAWWGVDVDKPTVRTTASSRIPTARAERDSEKTRTKDSARAPEANARTMRDAEATRIARDAAKAHQRARDRQRER